MTAGNCDFARWAARGSRQSATRRRERSGEHNFQTNCAAHARSALRSGRPLRPCRSRLTNLSCRPDGTDWARRAGRSSRAGDTDTAIPSRDELKRRVRRGDARIWCTRRSNSIHRAAGRYIARGQRVRGDRLCEYVDWPCAEEARNDADRTKFPACRSLAHGRQV